MTSDLSLGIGRAFKGCFQKSSWLIASIALFVITVSRIFAVMIAWESPNWIGFGLLFFVGSWAFPILAFAGVPLIRMYVKNCQGIKLSLAEAFKGSFDQALAAFALFLAIPCGMLGVWVLDAGDALLQNLPIFGDLWQSLFAFISFGLALTRVLLAIVGCIGLYLFTPEFALASKRPFQIIDALITNVQMPSMLRMKGFVYAFLPMILSALIMVLALFFSSAFNSSNMGAIWLLSWLSRSVLFSLVFSLPLLNFFHVSAEMLRLDRREHS